MVFVHGFGCGQEMWRHVAPAFEPDHRVILFDLPGSGAADPSTYDPVRHTHLSAYGDDVVALLEELEVDDAVVVGHSVSAMIAVLAQIKAPQRVARLVLVAPSARYLDDVGYVGGFSESDIADLLDLMNRNHLGWQERLAGIVAGAGPTGVRDELEQSFCRTRPDIAAQFAAVTFLSDNRQDLSQVSVPALVLQAREDLVAPLSAGEYVRDHLPTSEYVVIDTQGHCPHLSAPRETIDATRAFLDSVQV